MTAPHDTARWKAGYAIARVRQTPATFRNWPEVAGALVAQKLGRGPEELTFRIRNGQQITVPNLPGARVPPYEVFAEDTYDLRWFLGDLLDRPIHAMDIGAHVGTFAVWLCDVHPQAQVDCYEPAPDTVPYLQRNVDDNHLGHRITVHAQALAAETGWATFDQEGAGSGHNHLAVGDVHGSAAQVETVRFDEAVAAIGAPIDLVKMDCEGGEYDLVYASSPESWGSVRRLVLEYHPMGGEWSQLREWFAAAGLHVVRNSSGMRSARADLGTAWLSRDPLADHDGPRGRSRASTAAYEVRRLAQTPKAFRNWPALLSGLVRERVGRGPETLHFLSRSGVSITAPNVPGARLPAYEQFAEDGYRLDWFLGSLRNRPIHVLDVGAHVGTFACHLAHEHPSATVTCFEPSAGTAKFLRANIDANRFSDRISVVEAALTGETGVATFDDHGGASVHSGLVHDPAAVTTSGTAVEIPTLSFDDAIAAAPAPVVFVKLDCEGGEYQMAYQSSPESWSSVERVVLEYHDIPGESWADLRAWFASVGLHLVDQKSERADLGLAWLSRGPVE